MRLAQNITRIAARKASCSTNNTSLTASRIPSRKESTAVKSTTTPKDIRKTGLKFPSACSGVTLSDKVAIDGASNTVSSFFGAAFFNSIDPDIDQDERSRTEAERPNKVSQKPPTEDDIFLQWDAPSGEDIQRNDTPLSPELSLEDSSIYRFETPTPQAAMMRTTSLSPPPTPRPHRAMIQFISPPIPEELLIPVF